MYAKNETEPIFALVELRRNELARHQLFAAAAAGEVPIEILREFAFHQYSDSILWVPMLAQMRAKAVRSRRLARAIADNIACETGLTGTAHVALAVDLMRSIGLTSVDGFPVDTFATSASLWLSDEFAEFAEPAIAGWLFAAETLVPILFAGMQPGFQRLAGCDSTYFTEHVAVDCDEHGVWMAEAIDDVVDVYGPGSIPAILAGIADAHAETVQVPDALYGKLCASH